MKRLLFTFLGCLALISFSGITGCKSKKAVNQNVEPRQELSVEPPPPMPAEEPSIKYNLPPNVNNRIRVKITTSLGEMIVELYNETPQHRDNFVKLVNDGFYNDLLFHRCIKGFMIQGGDPNSRNAAPGAQLGVGGPGYTVPAEFNSAFLHKKGALAAARQGDMINPTKASSGSQFYLVQGGIFNDAQLDQYQAYIQKKNPSFTFTPEQRAAYKSLGGTPSLDMDYTVFGEVISGLEVIDAINSQPTLPGDRPQTDVKMRMEILK